MISAKAAECSCIYTLSHRECGQFRPIPSQAQSNPTARRGRNYLEFFKIFMNIGTKLSTLSMGQSIREPADILDTHVIIAVKILKKIHENFDVDEQLDSISMQANCQSTSKSVLFCSQNFHADAESVCPHFRRVLVVAAESPKTSQLAALIDPSMATTLIVHRHPESFILVIQKFNLYLGNALLDVIKTEDVDILGFDDVTTEVFIQFTWRIFFLEKEFNFIFCRLRLD